MDAATSVPRLLIVDDTPSNLIALGAVLKPLGVPVVEATSGKQALERIELGGYAAVLLDVQMPEMDGFEVAARLRATDKGRDVPIIFLTGIHRDEAYLRKGYAAGAADYVTKPFDAQILRARVKAFVDVFRQREGAHREEVRERTRERDDAVRKLVAFERIATLALTTADVDIFLRRLLGVFMEAADSADSAAILLREGDALTVRASIGVSNGAAHALSHDIVKAARPMLVEEAAVGADVRAVYGVPLMYQDELVGVTHIGSTTARDFSDADKQLLSAMSDRAAAAVAYVATRRQLERVANERTDLLARERAARAEAELANRAKDDFLATVSHELRTPLNAILGWTVTARSQSPPPQVDRALSIIERNARAQARIIEDVLDVSRIISGKLRLEMAATNVAEAIAGAVETVRPAAEVKGIELSVDVEDVGVITGDADRIQQVVWNVLTNAIKFTSAGGKVSLSATRDASRVVIRVSDTGQGIEPGFLPHLFEAFRQADGSTTRRHGGLGLGLAIVKQIVQAHGGSVRAESEGVEKGAKFTIELPARVLPKPFADRRAAAPTQHTRLDGLSILVVDDDEDARNLLREVLSSLGARVVCASSAREALSCVATIRPDVLVSDIGMPDMDGFGLIREIRRQPPDAGGWTPAIALTAYTRHEDGQQAFAAGFQTHLAKPIDPAYLVAAVANLARGGGARSHSSGGSRTPRPSAVAPEHASETTPSALRHRT